MRTSSSLKIQQCATSPVSTMVALKLIRKSKKETWQAWDQWESGKSCGLENWAARNVVEKFLVPFFLVSRYPPLGSSASPLGSCRHHGIPYLKPGLGHDAFMCFGHSAGQSSLRLFITAYHSCLQGGRWTSALRFWGVEPPQQAHQAFYVGFNATNSLEALVRTPGHHGCFKALE